MKPRIIEISTLASFSEKIEELQKDDSQLWYRGCGSINHYLTPSLYRHSGYNKIEDFVSLERHLITTFKQRSIPYLNRNISGDWEYLFLMQHHGVPTRLLDWSENPYIALYFALSTAVQMYDHKKKGFISDACVWILDPVCWNKKVLNHVDHNGSILTINDEELSGYFPIDDIRLLQNAPVAMYAAHNSARIVAQRGVFTIFGKTIDSMEKMFHNMDFPKDSLVCLTIKKENIGLLYKKLVMSGFTESTVYPDLDGLAKDIKRLYGFGGF